MAAADITSGAAVGKARRGEGMTRKPRTGGLVRKQGAAERRKKGGGGGGTGLVNLTWQ